MSLSQLVVGWVRAQRTGASEEVKCEVKGGLFASLPRTGCKGTAPSGAGERPGLLDALGSRRAVS